MFPSLNEIFLNSISCVCCHIRAHPHTAQWQSGASWNWRLSLLEKFFDQLEPDVHVNIRNCSRQVFVNFIKEKIKELAQHTLTTKWTDISDERWRIKQPLDQSQHAACSQVESNCLFKYHADEEVFYLLHIAFGVAAFKIYLDALLWFILIQNRKNHICMQRNCPHQGTALLFAQNWSRCEFKYQFD